MPRQRLASKEEASREEESVRLFSMLFQIVTLPVAVAKDAVCVIADAANGEFMPATKEKCADIDDEIFR